LLDWQVSQLSVVFILCGTTSIGTSPVLLNAVVIELVSMRCHYAKLISEFTKDRGASAHGETNCKRKHGIHRDTYLEEAVYDQQDSALQRKDVSKVEDTTCFQCLQGCGGRQTGCFLAQQEKHPEFDPIISFLLSCYMSSRSWMLQGRIYSSLTL
jgi:hypothetical protein